METTVSLVGEFIPVWNRNKEDPNPIVVEYKIPTMALKEKLFPKTKLKAILTKDGEFSSGESEIQVDNKRLNEEMITKIRNCTVNFNGRKIEIIVAKDLYGDVPPIIAGLADECGAHFQKILNERVDTKN